MMGWVIPLILVGGLAALPWLAERRRHGAEAFRAKAPGRFAKLGSGVTHYQWLGSGRGPVVVCVHGLTTPSPVWYALAAGMGQLGFRVLIYDLYGRGFSDAPRGKQDTTFFVRQLKDLLDHQNLRDEVTLIGYSMGGAIATAFTAQHSSYVRRLVLLASAGIWLRESRLTEWARGVPVLGDWVHHVILARRDRRALRQQLGDSFDIRGIIELQLAEYESRGFLRSVLSSRRYALAERLEDAHRTIGREGIPVVGLWAEHDDIIPLKSLGTLTQWNRSVRQEVINGADHRFPYTHAAETTQVLASVLREDLGRGV